MPGSTRMRFTPTVTVPAALPTACQVAPISPFERWCDSTSSQCATPMAAQCVRTSGPSPPPTRRRGLRPSRRSRRRPRRPRPFRTRGNACPGTMMKRRGSSRTASYLETAISSRSVQSPCAHSQITVIVRSSVPKSRLRLSICSFTWRKIDSLRPTRLTCSSLMKPPLADRGRARPPAAVRLAHHDVVPVLFEDVAFGVMAARDREGVPVLADALVLRAVSRMVSRQRRRRTRRGTAHGRAVARAPLCSADRLVRLTESGFVLRALFLVLGSHEPDVSPAAPGLHIGLGSPHGSAPHCRRLDQPRPRRRGETAAASRRDRERRALLARARRQGREPGGCRCAFGGRGRARRVCRPGRARRRGARRIARSRRRGALDRQGRPDRDRADHRRCSRGDDDCRRAWRER